MTADNPHGQVVAEEDNIARRIGLARFLAGEGLVWHLAIGGAPDGDNREPGALVLGLDVRSAAELGARFEQAAVYVWAPFALHLVACTDDRHEILGYQAMPGSELRSPA